MRRLLLFLLMFLLLVAVSSVPAAAQASSSSDEAATEPLTEPKILAGLEGGITNKRLATLVGQLGIDFSPTPQIEQKLRSAGANDELVEAIRKAKIRVKNLLIGTDADCTVRVNRGVFELKAGQFKEIEGLSGDNLIQATRKGESAVGWQKVVTMQSSEQKVVLIELKPPSPPKPQPQPLPTPPQPQPAPVFVPSAVQGTWDMKAASFRGRNYQRFTIIFPPGGTLASVWGTDLYTDDSSIATAAVHAGLITPQSGGVVTIEIRPGTRGYIASTHNGVTSRKWGKWFGSFVFVGGGGSMR